MIEVANLSVRLGDRVALDDVSFRAARGEFVCFLGPNGAGKTTLLRAIAGLVASKQRLEGRVSLDGDDLLARPLSQRAKLIAYLPQGHAAHWPISVRSVVAIGRLPHGRTELGFTAEDHAVVARALQAVDAAHLVERAVTELSGGERARVLLARALAVEAPVLLADEAVAALDPGHQLAVMELMSATAKRGGIVLTALHDLTLAARYASRILVLDRGRIVADGPPADVLGPERGPEVLARVFGIRAVHLQHAGLPVVVPWSTGADSRSDKPGEPWQGAD